MGFVLRQLERDNPTVYYVGVASIQEAIEEFVRYEFNQTDLQVTIRSEEKRYAIDPEPTRYVFEIVAHPPQFVRKYEAIGVYQTGSPRLFIIDP